MENLMQAAKPAKTRTLYVQMSGAIEPTAIRNGTKVDDIKREDAQGRDISVWRVSDGGGEIVGEFAQSHIAGWWFGE